MEKLKILVVDDKKIIGDLFEFTLGYGGHEIQCTNDPEEAIRLIKEEEFDIAFMDIVMPVKDGVNLLSEFKLLVPDLPVVMMSGYTVEEKLRKTKELGAVSCLKKPFEMEDVRKAVKQALGKEI